MAKVSIGLEVSPNGVRAARLRGDKGSVTLDLLAEEPLVPGIVVPGGVSDAPALTEAVKALWAKYKLGQKTVTLGIAGPRVVVRSAAIPLMPVKDVRAALPLYVAEMPSIEVAESVLDYVINGESLDDDGKRQFEGLLVATTVGPLSEVIDAIQAAKVQVEAVDLTAFGVLRAMVPPMPAPPQPGLQPGFQVVEAVVSIGSMATQVIVHRNRRPALVRDLAVGSDVVVDALSHVDLNSVTATQQALDPLVSQITETVGFYETGEGAVPPSRVLVTGSGSMLPGLEYALGSALGAPVSRDAAWLNLPRDPKTVTNDVLRAFASRMAAAVGLALGEVAP